jgi:signal transduction histidine kinase
MKRIVGSIFDPSGEAASGAAVVVLSGCLFVGVFGLRLASDDGSAAIALLYTVPIAILASRFGLAGGLAGATSAMLLSVAFQAVKGWDYSVLAYLTRATAFFLLGGLVGWHADNQRRARAKLREYDRLKDDFLRSMCHDMKTPLTSISSLAQLMQQPGSSQRKKESEWLGRISRNVSEMNDMLDQIMEFSRLEAGKTVMYADSLQLRAAVCESVEDCSDTLEGHPLTTSIPRDLLVCADARALRRVLLNLLMNAAKFSPDGASIAVAARPAESEAVVSVEDHGPGIPLDEQARIFERFYQCPANRSGNGAGIGLNIVQRYVELLDGRVWLLSEPGSGTTMFFTLPLASDD